MLAACYQTNPTPTFVDGSIITAVPLLGVANHSVNQYSWSADGTEFAIVTGDLSQIQNDLYLVSSTGGQVRVLVKSDRHVYMYWPVYLPGGQSIGVYVTNLGQPGIWALHLDSLQFTFVLSAESVKPSPDGKELAEVVGPVGHLPYSRWEVRVINAQDTSIVESIPVTSTGYIRVSEVTWSPDSTALAFSETSAGTATPSLLRASGVHGHPVNQSLEGARGYTDPAWSPDGRYLATVAATPGQNSGQLVIWDLSTGCQEQLTGVDGLSYPKWSPNGERLAFAYLWSLYVLDVSKARSSGRLQSVCNNYPATPLP